MEKHRTIARVGLALLAIFVTLIVIGFLNPPPTAAP